MPKLTDLDLSLFNELPSHVWIADSQGILIFANTAWIEYSGKPKESVIEYGLASVIHPEDVEAASRTWRKCLRDARPFELQVRLRSKKNSYHWFTVNAKPVLDENGQLDRFIGINTRIYASHLSAPEIQLSPDRMIDLIVSSQVCQLVLDSTRRKIYYQNSKQKDLFGFPMPTEFSDPSELYTFVDPKFQETINSVIEKNKNGENAHLSFRLVFPNGSERFLDETSSPVLDDTGKVVAIILRVSEITKQHYLKEENELLLSVHEHVLRNVSDGVWIADQATGENILTSDSYKKMCGFPVDVEVTYQMWHDAIHKDDIAMVEEHIEQQKLGATFDIEYRMTHSDGKTVWILDRTLPTAQFGERPVVGGIMTDITEFKLAELRAKEEKAKLEAMVTESEFDYQQLYNNTPIGHHSLSPDGKFTHINKTELDWLGYTEKEMLSKKFVDILAPGQEEIFKNAFAKFRSEGHIFNLPYNVLRKDGSILPVIINSTSKVDDDGNYIESYSTMFDNTELNKAKEQLEAQEARYHSIFEDSPAMIYLRDFSSRKIVEANLATLTTLGYSLEELNELPIEELIIDYVPRDDLEKRLLEEGSVLPRLRKYKTKNGRLLDMEVSYSLIYGLDDQPYQIQFVCNDLTERYEADRKMRQQRTFVQQLLNTLSVGVIVTDEDLNVEYLNNYFAKYIGIDQDLKNVLNLDQILPAELIERVAETLARGYSTGSLNIETALPRVDGVIKQLLVIATSREEDSGLILTFVDVTAEKELEANLIISRDALQKANVELENAVKLKDEFLANMSHELRTPLTGIIGLTEILLTEQLGALSAQQKELMRNIDESGNHLHELINEILDLSRIGAGKFEMNMRIFSVNEVCAQAIKMVEGLALKKKIVIDQELAEDKPLIYGDQRRLKQVLVNLLGNALKFTPESGRVGIFVLPQPSRETLRVTVWDTGIGIPEKDLAAIFQPFTQLESHLSRQFSGTGLGLTLSRHIIDMHNGTLSVESEERKGSKFHIELPFHPDPSIEGLGISPSDHTSILSTNHLRTAAFPFSVNKDPADLIKKFKAAGIRVFQPENMQELVKLRLQKVNLILFFPSHAVSREGTVWVPQVRADKTFKNTMLIKTDDLDDPYLIGVPSIATDMDMERTRDAVDRLFRENWKNIEGSFIGKTQRHILVVEDNTINRTVMVDFLRGKGYRVSEAANGEEAIQVASRSMPELILMDIQMPVLNGLDATRVIRQLDDANVSRVPIIAVTISHNPDDVTGIYEAGCDDLLEKPIDLGALEEKIKTVLGKENG